jgi:nuclear RNA export factor
MGTAPRAALATRVLPKPQNPSSTRALTELRVTGWTDDSEIQKVTQFLERHAAKRNGSARSGGVVPHIIKKSRVAGDQLVINVRAEDVPAFAKINGFSFTSKHGAQKLNISGQGIRSKSPNDAAAADPERAKETANTIELLKGFLERRYDATQKLLNFSSIAEDSQVAAVGMFTEASRRSKFFPVLMTLIDQQLTTADQKREAFHSVTLSNNLLPDLYLVKDLFITIPFIKNLDISGNKISKTKDLLPFKNKLRDLEHLILSNNPLETLDPGWEQTIIGWFPRLRILNGQTVRTEEQIARLNAPKKTPIPSSTNLWLDAGSVAQNFLVDFIAGFDNDRSALIQKYYDNASTFTMSVNTQAKGGAGRQHDKTPWDSYLPQSRNIKFVHSKRTRFQRKYRGSQQIQEAWSKIPPTRHPGLDTNKYSFDCQPQPGLPDPTGQYDGVDGLMITVHGEYEEHRTAKGANEIARRAFDRTFVLGPGGSSGVRVISDLCCLRAAGGLPAWIPQSPSQPVQPVQPVQGAQPVQAAQPPPAAPALPTALTPEQEAMVVHVHQATKLTLEMATQCLIAGNWDLEAAAIIFNEQKGNLPPDAFVAA